MINEKFLISAVEIKRTYNSLMSDLDKYEERAKVTSRRMDKIVEKGERIEKDLSDPKKRLNMKGEDVLEKMMAILSEIEDESASVEKFLEPITKKIDELAKDEVKLFEMIRDAHPELTHEDIFNSVQERIRREGLL
jgi:predicted  nucleic acid-binding Zn-ribbon protein